MYDIITIPTQRFEKKIAFQKFFGNKEKTTWE